MLDLRAHDDRPAPALNDGLASRWRAAFAAACAEHAIDGALESGPLGLAVRFAGQENADPELMLGAFVDEMARAGVHASALLVPRADLGDTDAARAEAALRHAVARMRTLLVEFNSYLSGGLAWGFAAADQPIAASGLAIYRFPARADVDVTAAPGAGVEVDVHQGDLGEVTSSGFYVPRWLRGDLEVTIRYEVLDWRPGPAAASFALFLQDEPSELRYYAQRRSAGAGKPEVLGNFHNRVLTEPHALHDASGALRLTRRGAAVTAWHRDEGAWHELGTHPGDAVKDLLPGAKIWSSGPCGRLRARFFDLVVDATLAPDAEQILPVPVRPDPRS